LPNWSNGCYKNVSQKIKKESATNCKTAFKAHLWRPFQNGQRGKSYFWVTCGIFCYHSRDANFNSVWYLMRELWLKYWSVVRLLNFLILAPNLTFNAPDTYHVSEARIWLTLGAINPNPTVDTGGKIIFFFFLILFFLDTDPHLASVVCVLYLFSVSRYELRVCMGTCVCVCVWAQIWSRHQPWEILRCDWAPMSNRFYLI
jgi:hypothetical protein